nr:putative replicase protein [Jasmine mosaic-associated virus 2]
MSFKLVNLYLLYPRARELSSGKLRTFLGLLRSCASVAFTVARTTAAVQTGLALGVAGGLIEHVTRKKINFDPAALLVARIAGIDVPRDVIPVERIPVLHSPEDVIKSCDNLADHPTMESDDCLEDSVIEEVESKKVVKRRRCVKKPSFAAIIAAEAKSHFGGMPTNSKANSLSVMKFLVNRCNEHKLTSLQTRECSSLAFPLVFSPDPLDKYIYTFLNSDNAHERRMDYLQSMSVESIWMSVLCSPLSGRSWKRAFLHLTNLGVQEAFTFVK